MPNLYYYDALKRGQKEFRACTARGEYPYLPTLSEIVGEEQLGHTIHTSPLTQYNGALGAALFAYQKYLKEQKG